MSARTDRLLPHRGRASGRTCTKAVLHVRDGDDLVVAASGGGIDREPQWWLNLQADPRGFAEAGGRRLVRLSPVAAERAA